MAQTAIADERARAQRRVRWELLVGLIRKDLKIKYQGSVLGFFWSLANPLLLLGVYSIALVKPHLTGWREFVYYLNPMGGIVVSMQRALYADDAKLTNGTRVLADPGYLYYVDKLAIGAVVSGLLLWLGLRTYHRLAADFAEEL